MSENKFEIPVLPPEEESEQKQETPPEQETEQEEGWEKISPEETEEYKTDFAENIEKVKINIEELKAEIAAEQDEATKQEKAELLVYLEDQVAQYETDYEPATHEEELEIKIRSYKGE